jgi:hypothetical protein
MAKKKEPIKDVIIPSGMVTIIGTLQSKSLKTNKEYEVSSELAATLIKKGSAILKTN